jgi:hypothetical protein
MLHASPIRGAAAPLAIAGGWRSVGCDGAGPTVQPGESLTCTPERCDGLTADGAFLFDTDGMGDDEGADAVEIPWVAQVAPSTCTP